MTKRMQLQLDDETHRLLMEMSEVTGATASSIVVSILRMSRPQIQRSIDEIRRAGHTVDDVFWGLVDMVQSRDRSGKKAPLRRAPRK